MRPPVTVERAAHLAGAAYLMKHSGESALVVTADDDSHSPVAVITDADIGQALASGRHPEYTRISDLTLGPPTTIERRTSAREALRLMISHRMDRLPVVEGGRLFGMVDIADLCRVLL